MIYNRDRYIVEDYREILNIIKAFYNIKFDIFSVQSYCFDFDKVSVEVRDELNFDTSISSYFITSTNFQGTITEEEISIASYLKYVKLYNSSHGRLDKILCEKFKFTIGDSLFVINNYQGVKSILDVLTPPKKDKLELFFKLPKLTEDYLNFIREEIGYKVI